MKKQILLISISLLSLFTNAQTWSTIGKGVNSEVDALIFYNGELYAGGYLYSTSNSEKVIWKWSGTAWATFGEKIGGITNVFTIYNGLLHLGGSITYGSDGNTPVGSIEKWNGTNWVAVGTGVTVATSPAIYAFAVYNGELYVGGSFSKAGGNSANNIAKWNGTSWSAVGTGTNDRVNALSVCNGKLYAGGYFTTADGKPTNYIAKWDGFSWSSVGSGVGGINGLGTGANGNIYNKNMNVYSLTTDTVNNILYVGGGFSTAGGIKANGIAKWDGVNWSGLGTGVNGGIIALTMNNGDLYVGGSFTTAGGNSANYIAKWNGADWSNVGTGLDYSGEYNRGVVCLISHNGDVYAGGDFTLTGSKSVTYIAKWGLAPTAISTPKLESINISPNPVKDCFKASGLVGKGIVSVTNLNGKVLLTKQIINNEQISISGLFNGVYILKLTTEDGILVRKIIKE